MDAFFSDYIWPFDRHRGARACCCSSSLLIVIAYVLYADRKVWAAVQMRRGPNVVGPWGLLQSFADLLKFVLKEPVIPAGANKGVFLLAPLVTCMLALAAWAVIPVDAGWVIADINVGILYLFAISSLGVYGIIMAGWASNSKYPFLARCARPRRWCPTRSRSASSSSPCCLRRLAQPHRHRRGAEDGSAPARPAELSLDWYWLPLLPMFVVFFISALAETNRPPFDLVEAESELVAGFMVEYRSTPYLLFMLGEYVAIVTMCAMTTILFLGGWLPPFAVAAVHLGPGHRLVPAQGCCSCSSCSPW